MTDISFVMLKSSCAASTSHVLATVCNHKPTQFDLLVAAGTTGSIGAGWRMYLSMSVSR